MFITLFVVVSLVSLATFVSSTAPKKINKREDGYDCGKYFFTDQMVQQALKMASTRNECDNLRPYIGPLYDSEMNYLTWPIVQDEKSHKIKTIKPCYLWRKTIYQVVFNKHGKVIDLIAKITTFDFVKCWRVRNSELETRILGIEEARGYYCGHRFIPRLDLEISTNFALKHLNGDRFYPKPYEGHLYSRELGYLIWPIYRGQDFYRYGNGPGGPYFIVIAPEGQPKDIIVRTVHNEFIKCQAIDNTLTATSTSTQNEINIKFPRSGFDCNGIFFDDKDMQVARDIAQDTRKRKEENEYPTMHLGPPFDHLCFFWPINPHSKRFTPGNPGVYRLVLTLDFDIMCVVMQNKNVIKKCERKTIIASSSVESGDNRTNYLCFNSVFTHSELVSVAQTACLKLKARNVMFPRKYKGIEFEVPGPYYIYPILKGKNFQSIPGKNRMVMNYKCEVAGALTTNLTTGNLIKCKVSKYL